MAVDLAASMCGAAAAEPPMDLDEAVDAVIGTLTYNELGACLTMLSDLVSTRTQVAALVRSHAQGLLSDAASEGQHADALSAVHDTIVACTECLALEGDT